MIRLLMLIVGFALQAICSVNAAAEDAPDYSSQIAPLLKAHCVKCHGPAKQEEGLNLSTSVDMARGNDGGAVILPHDLEASRLWKQVQSDKMPPDAPLSEAQKALLQRWIISGAPGLSPASIGNEPEKHWAFRPFGDTAVPTVLNPDGLVNAIDYFVQAALETRNIKANSEGILSC